MTYSEIEHQRANERCIRDIEVLTENQASADAFDMVCVATHPAPDCGGPCATCAFRQGTDANQTWYTVALARLCVEGFRYFHCHEHPRLCRGFIAALHIRGVPITDADKAWCEAAGEMADIFADAIEAGRQADLSAAMNAEFGLTYPSAARIIREAVSE